MESLLQHRVRAKTTARLASTVSPGFNAFWMDLSMKSAVFEWLLQTDAGAGPINWIWLDGIRRSYDRLERRYAICYRQTKLVASSVLPLPR
jgi:hypothetical protein